MLEFNYSGTVEVAECEMEWFIERCQACKSVTGGMNSILNEDEYYGRYINPVIDQLQDYVRAKLAEEGLHFDD